MNRRNRNRTDADDGGPESEDAYARGAAAEGEPAEELDVDARLLKLWGDRDEIRQRSAQWTLGLLRERLIALG